MNVTLFVCSHIKITFLSALCGRLCQSCRESLFCFVFCFQIYWFFFKKNLFVLFIFFTWYKLHLDLTCFCFCFVVVDFFGCCCLWLADGLFLSLVISAFPHLMVCCTTLLVRTTFVHIRIRLLSALCASTRP